MSDVHRTHCCIVHGCKYGDDDCSVATGIEKQAYNCEQCGLEEEGYYGKKIAPTWEQKWANKNKGIVVCLGRESSADSFSATVPKDLIRVIKNNCKEYAKARGISYSKVFSDFLESHREYFENLNKAEYDGFRL